MTSLNEALSSLQSEMPTLEALLKPIEMRDEHNSFLTLQEKLSVEVVNYESDTLLPLALRTLLICVLAVDHLDTIPDTEELDKLNWGASDRIALRYWNKTAKRIGTMNFKTALQYILEVFVVSQHCSIAANRFDGRTSRLRINLDEEGLIPLIARPWRPVVSADRLETALSLLSEIGLIVGNSEDGYSAANPNDA